jgi:hypothetical protein
VAAWKKEPYARMRLYLQAGHLLNPLDLYQGLYHFDPFGLHLQAVTQRFIQDMETVWDSSFSKVIPCDTIVALWIRAGGVTING